MEFRHCDLLWEPIPLETLDPTMCGATSTMDGHPQRGPPTTGTAWPSSSLVSSALMALVAPRDLNNLSFPTHLWPRGGEGDGAKFWPKPHLDAAHGPGFPYKIQLCLCPVEEGRSRVGFKPLNGIYPGLPSGLVADEELDMGLLPFLFLLLMEMND